MINIADTSVSNRDTYARIDTYPPCLFPKADKSHLAGKPARAISCALTLCSISEKAAIKLRNCAEFQLTTVDQATRPDDIFKLASIASVGINVLNRTQTEPEILNDLYQIFSKVDKMLLGLKWKELTGSTKPKTGNTIENKALSEDLHRLWKSKLPLTFPVDKYTFPDISRGQVHIKVDNAYFRSVGLPDTRANAEIYKGMGDSLHKAHNYDDAIVGYARALHIYKEEAVKVRRSRQQKQKNTGSALSQVNSVSPGLIRSNSQSAMSPRAPRIDSIDVDEMRDVVTMMIRIGRAILERPSESKAESNPKLDTELVKRLLEDVKKFCCLSMHEGVNEGGDGDDAPGRDCVLRNGLNPGEDKANDFEYGFAILVNALLMAHEQSQHGDVVHAYKMSCAEALELIARLLLKHPSKGKAAEEFGKSFPFYKYHINSLAEYKQITAMKTFREFYMQALVITLEACRMDMKHPKVVGLLQRFKDALSSQHHTITATDRHDSPNFGAQELPVKKGQKIQIIQVHAGWVEGKNEDTKVQGWFPAECLVAALGLKWKEVGSQEPTQGQEVKNKALAAKLQERLEFTKDEWDRFGLSVSDNSYIRAGDRFFKLAEDLNSQAMKYLQKMRSSSLTAIRHFDCSTKPGFFQLWGAQPRVQELKCSEKDEITILREHASGMVEGIRNLGGGRGWFPMSVAPDEFRGTLGMATGSAHEEEAGSCPCKKKSNAFTAVCTLGLRWLNIGNEEPAHVRDLQNSELAKALMRQTVFTKQEWYAFGVNELRIDHVVKSGDCYFKPAGYNGVEIVAGKQLSDLVSIHVKRIAKLNRMWPCRIFRVLTRAHDLSRSLHSDACRCLQVEATKYTVKEWSCTEISEIGSRWEAAGPENPKIGCEIVNPKLVDALKTGKTVFTPQEAEEYFQYRLTCNSYIKAGNEYFKVLISASDDCLSGSEDMSDALQQGIFKVLDSHTHHCLKGEAAPSVAEWGCYAISESLLGTCMPWEQRDMVAAMFQTLKRYHEDLQAETLVEVCKAINSVTDFMAMYDGLAERRLLCEQLKTLLMVLEKYAGNDDVQRFGLLVARQLFEKLSKEEMISILQESILALLDGICNASSSREKADIIESSLHILLLCLDKDGAVRNETAKMIAYAEGESKVGNAVNAIVEAFNASGDSAASEEDDETPADKTRKRMCASIKKYKEKIFEHCSAAFLNYKEKFRNRRHAAVSRTVKSVDELKMEIQEANEKFRDEKKRRSDDKRAAEEHAKKMEDALTNAKMDVMQERERERAERAEETKQLRQALCNAVDRSKQVQMQTTSAVNDVEVVTEKMFQTAEALVLKYGTSSQQRRLLPAAVKVIHQAQTNQDLDTILITVKTFQDDHHVQEAGLQAFHTLSEQNRLMSLDVNEIATFTFESLRVHQDKICVVLQGTCTMLSLLKNDHHWDISSQDHICLVLQGLKNHARAPTEEHLLHKAKAGGELSLYEDLHLSACQLLLMLWRKGQSAQETALRILQTMFDDELSYEKIEDPIAVRILQRMTNCHNSSVWNKTTQNGKKRFSCHTCGAGSHCVNQAEVTAFLASGMQPWTYDIPPWSIGVLLDSFSTYPSAAASALEAIATLCHAHVEHRIAFQERRGLVWALWFFEDEGRDSKIVEDQASRAETEKRLQEAGGKEGAINVSLIWDNAVKRKADLDIHVQCSQGTISFQNQQVGHGKLDVDMQQSREGACIENVYWGSPDTGTFKVMVNSYQDTSGCTTPFKVSINTKVPLTLIGPQGDNIQRNFVGFKTFEGKAAGYMSHVFDFEVDTAKAATEARAAEEVAAAKKKKVSLCLRLWVIVCVRMCAWLTCMHACMHASTLAFVCKSC